MEKPHSGRGVLEGEVASVAVNQDGGSGEGEDAGRDESLSSCDANVKPH